MRVKCIHGVRELCWNDFVCNVCCLGTTVVILVNYGKRMAYVLSGGSCNMHNNYYDCAYCVDCAFA